MAQVVENWNVDMEVNLFHAMRGHKPVGVNRYFQMICIYEKLNNASCKKIAIDQVWNHLSKMYDLMALNESEIFPFPNRQNEFTLNSIDFGKLAEQEFPRFKPEEDDLTLDEIKFESSKSEGKAERIDASGIQRTPASSPGTLNASLVSALVTSNTPDSSPKRKRTRQNLGAELSAAKRRR